VSENVWGPTTGKHINSVTGVTDKADRMPRQDFIKATEERFKSL